MGGMNRTAVKASTQSSVGIEETSDKELVANAKAGSRRAFQQLYERYHRRAFAVALGVLRHPEDAHDVVQESFIKAYRYLDRFEGKSSFYTWLYRIVKNLAIDYLRKRKRGMSVSFDDTAANLTEDSFDDLTWVPKILGQNPGKSLLRAEIREQIAAALENLSPNHRAVIVMREVEGLSYEEMAEVLECSKGTIMSRLFHARKYMQTALAEYKEGRDERSG